MSEIPILPTVLLFDVGNVVIDADHAITYKILQDFGVSATNAELFYSNNEYLEFSRGNITGYNFYRILVDKYLKFPLTYKQVVDAHDRHIYGINKDVENILQKLSSYRLAFTTDTNEWQTAREYELIDLQKYSNAIFRSHEIHMLKVDDGLFPYILKQLDVEPEEMLFIDDSPEKINVAKKTGILAVQFKNAEQLSEFFKKAISNGVQPAEPRKKSPRRRFFDRI